MTEIPEHLLKRSKERRAAIGGEEAPAAEAASTAETAPATTSEPAETAPVAAAAATPPAEVTPPPKPVRPEVAAALKRKRIPFWAMPVLLGLPVWAWVYPRVLEPPPAGEDDPVALGEAVYGGCAGCHGPSGAGVGSTPGLGDVLEVWPDFRDHMMWVKLGDPGWPADTYGATDKPKGTGMPPHEALSDQELAQVVLYERVSFGGLEEGSEEFLALVEIAEGVTTFADAGLGPESEADGVDPSNLGG